MCLITRTLITFQVTTHKFSKLLQFHPRTQKVMYQFTCTGHKTSDNSEVQRALQNCGFSVRTFVHVSILTPRTERWFIYFFENLWHSQSKLFQTQNAGSDHHSCYDFVGKCSDLPLRAHLRRPHHVSISDNGKNLILSGLIRGVSQTHTEKVL
jgi:hypothetical protein